MAKKKMNLDTKMMIYRIAVFTVTFALIFVSLFSWLPSVHGEYQFIIWIVAGVCFVAYIGTLIWIIVGNLKKKK